MNLTRYIFFLIVLTHGLEVYSQQEACASLITNQPYYFLGDTISAKTIIKESCWPQNHPLEITLVDPFGKFVIRQLVEYQGNPEFQLPLSGLTHEGMYQLALSFPKASDDLLLKHDLAIMEESLPETGTTLRPEKLSIITSGNLVKGLNQQLMVHITGADQQGITTEGFIIDHNGNEIKKFVSDHLGMARLDLTPDSAQYQVVIPEWSLKEDLPPPVEQGFSISKSVVGPAVRFTVHNRQEKGNFKLSLFHYGGENLEKTFTISENDSLVNLDLVVLQWGFFNLTVTEVGDDNPVWNQWIFLPEHGTKFPVDISPNPQTPGDNVVIAVPDDIKYPVFCSVLDLNQIPNRIYSLKQNPQWIKAFAETHPDNIQKLEAFVTWWAEKYVPRDIIGEVAPEYGSSIQGRLTNENGQPQKYTPVILTIPTIEDGLHYSVTSSQGIFRFKGLVTQGDQSGYLYPMLPLVDSVENLKLEILSTDSLSTGKSYWVDCLKKSLVPEIQRRLHYKKITEQFDDDSPAIDLLPVESTEQLVSIYGEADHVFRLDNYVAFETMREVIKETVKDVNFVKRTSIRVYSHELQKNYQGKPLLLVDGIPTLSDSVILRMDPATLDRVEVITNRRKLMRLSSISQFGIVAFYTKQGTDVKDMDGVTKVLIQGYDPSFLPPQTKTQYNRDPRVPELHPDIYWDPGIKPGESLNLKLPHNYTEFAIHAGYFRDGSYYSSYQTLKSSWQKVP